MGGRTKPDGTVDFTNLDHNDANPLPGATLTTEDPLTGLNELAAQVKASVALTPAVAPWTIDNRIETVAEGAEPKLKNPKVDPADPTTIVLEGTIAAVGACASVAELESLPLSQEVTHLMKVSYNRGAQTLVCRLAASIGETECYPGMAVAKNIWADAGLDVLGTSLIDGSGLEGNYITPENAVEIQSLMAKRPDAAGRPPPRIHRQREPGLLRRAGRRLRG